MDSGETKISDFVHKETSGLKFYSNIKVLGWTGRNKHEQQRKKFFTYSELLNKKLSAIGLPISDAFKTEIVEKAINLSNQIKKRLPIFRINLKSCFIVAAYTYIKNTITSQFLDLRLIAQAFDGFKISGKQLARYLDFYKKDIQKVYRVDKLSEIREATTHILHIFIAGFENGGKTSCFVDKSTNLLEKLLNFSTELNVRIKTKKLKNISIALAYIFIRLYYHDEYQLSELIESIKSFKSNNTPGIAQNDSSLLDYKQASVYLEGKLTGEIKYSSVYKLYDLVITLLKTYVYDNCIQDAENYAYIIRKKDKLKYSILKMKKLIETKEICNRAHFTLILTTAFKCKSFLEKRELFSRKGTENSLI